MNNALNLVVIVFTAVLMLFAAATINPLDTSTGKLIIARSGGGKGNLVDWLLLFIIRRWPCWVRAYFPHPIDALILIRELIAMFGDAIAEHLIIEDFDRIDKVVPRQFLGRPEGASHWEHEKHVAEIIAQTLDRWLQMRPDIPHIDERPNFVDLGTTALNAYLDLDCWFPESKIGDIILPGSAEWHFALTHCMSDRAKLALRRLEFIATRDWLNTILAAKRFIDRSQKAVMIASRTDTPQTVDLRSFHQAGGIFIGFGGATNASDLRTIVSCDFHHMAWMARNGLPVPGVFLIDELLNYDLFTRSMATAVPSLRFTQMQPWLVTTGLFNDEFLTQTVFQNCSILAGPIGDPATAEYVASAFRVMFDEHEPHHYTETLRTTPELTYEERVTLTKSKAGTSVSTTIVPVVRHREWRDFQPVFHSGHERQFWLAKRFMTSPVGTFAVREQGAEPYMWQVPLVKDSWAIPGLGSAKVTEWINRMYATHPAYAVPNPPVVVPPPPAPARARASSTAPKPAVRRATPRSSRSRGRSR